MIARFALTAAILVGVGGCQGTLVDASGTPGSLSVGPSGGTVREHSGATVTVPAGALSSQVLIEVSEVAAPVPLPAGVALSGAVYAVTPHGQTFASPVTLVLPAPPTAGAELLTLAGPRATAWQPVPSASFSGGRVTVQLSHFSFFGVVHVTNPCASDNGGCDPNAACTPVTATTRTCTCNPGYAGTGETCAFVGTCAQGEGHCDPHAACTDTVSGPVCACLAGWVGSGQSCQTVCSRNNGGCDTNAACTDPGSAATPTCTCNDGFAGDGLTCADPCASNNGGCDPNATCTAPAHSAVCTCNQGFVPSGTTCLPIPIITSVKLVSGLACEGFQGTYAATATGSPTIWGWDLGAGVTALESPTPSAETFLFDAPGTYSGTVDVANANGAGPAFPLSYTVAAPAPITWQTGSVVSTGADLCLTAGPSGPALAYYDSSDSSLHFALATALAPASPADWQTTTVDPAPAGGMVGLSPAVRTGASSFFIAYRDLTNAAVKFAFASTSAPSNWTIYTLDAGTPASMGGSGAGSYISLELSSGVPVVVYRDDTLGAIKVAWAASAAPSSPGDWTFFTVDSSTTDVLGRKQLGLGMVQGVPFLSYWDATSDSLKVAYATSATPATATWVTQVVDLGGGGSDSSIVEFGGGVAVSYIARSTSALALAVADSPAPVTANWTLSSIPGTNPGAATHIGAVGGRLAVTYSDLTTGEGMFARALVSAPASQADWSLTSFASAPSPTYTSTAAWQNGEAGVAYVSMAGGIFLADLPVGACW